MKHFLTSKWTHLLIAMNLVLFSSGCVINGDDVADAVAAPVVGAISDVISAMLSTFLTNLGLLPAS